MKSEPWYYSLSMTQTKLAFLLENLPFLELKLCTATKTTKPLILVAVKILTVVFRLPLVFLVVATKPLSH